jgi:hypothetical protein
MPRARLLLLSLAVALSVVALSASSASAKISYEWFVGGSLLKAGEQRTFSLNNDNHTFDFHGTVAGLAILLLSTKVSVEHGLILGGRPGANEETVLLEGATVDQPKGCLVESLPSPVTGTIRTKPLKSEIVEGKNGEVLILYTPQKEGEPIATLLFLKNGSETCVAANVSAEVTGSILGLPLPQRAEVLRQVINFPSQENLFLAAACPPETAALRFAGELATLSGLTLSILASDAVFGPF